MAAAHPRRDLSPHLITSLPRMVAVPPGARPHASSPRAPSSSRASRSVAMPELVRPSRMAPALEDVPMQVGPWTEIKKRGREEDGEDGDEREERLRARVTALASIPDAAKAAATTAAGTASKEDSAAIASFSGTIPPRPCVRQQFGRLLARVIEGDLDATSSTCMPMVATAAMPSPIWSSSIENAPPVSRAMQGGQRCKKRKSPSARSNINLNADLEEVTQLEELNAETSSRAMQGGQRCKRRKSPCSNNFMLRSPLSRMMLSPISRTPRAQFQVRSPSSSQGMSPLATFCGGRRMLAKLDLNVLDIDLTIEDTVEDDALNIEEGESQNVGLDAEHEGLQDIDLNIELEEEVHDAALNMKATRKELSDDQSRAVFDAMLAKSRDAELVGHETREVSQELSVPMRTVQRIWKKGKRCLDLGIPVDVSSGKKKRGRKKIEVDVSTLSTLDIGRRSTIEDLSTHLNVLDLGFFNSIQSIQYKDTSRTLEDLVAAVDKAFREYSVEKANRIFLTLQACMKEIMRIGGGNRYDTPHIRKQMLERQGLLPLQLGCELALVQEVMAKMNE